ncbi:uncharacterized protein G2W53_017328 [Senna tora]|uniref:Uncharacterized protein n=1 Tax=Senna tora TaxID=362788 RepID=A0A834TQZ8_9FABA|nr:uncharacterized protein G2W53_017328 [Senna tora]
MEASVSEAEISKRWLFVPPQRLPVCCTLRHEYGKEGESCLIELRGIAD